MKPLYEDTFDAGDIIIGTPVPPEVNVDYLQEVLVPVNVTNKTENPVMLEMIALHFHVSPEASTPEEAMVVHKCQGAILNAKASKYWNIKVRPNLFFEEHTNCYSVNVVYRVPDNGGLSGPLSATKPEGMKFLIINTPPAIYGRAFISYKDKEDLGLAKGLFALAHRSGFLPYMAPPDIKPGLPIWKKKITSAIKDCNFAFIIWTAETEKGTGVPREVKLCRKFGKEEVLLLEEDISVPKLYQSKMRRERERVPFKRSNAFKTFAEVVVARRQMIENG